MDFKWISSGELAAGQFVTVLGLKPQKKEVLLPTGEMRTITEEDKNPWIKGVPFRVLNVKLPLIMLHNICKVPNIPPAVFYDTRLVELLEVDEEYAVTYKMAMFPPTPPQPELMMALPANEAGAETDPQQVFNFDKPDEEGPPPLVPK